MRICTIGSQSILELQQPARQHRKSTVRQHDRLSANLPPRMHRPSPQPSDSTEMLSEPRRCFFISRRSVSAHLVHLTLPIASHPSPPLPSPPNQPHPQHIDPVQSTTGAQLTMNDFARPAPWDRETPPRTPACGDFVQSLSLLDRAKLLPYCVDLGTRDSCAVPPLC